MVNRHGFLEDGDLYSEDGHSQAESQRDTHHGAFGYTQNDSSDEEAGLFERVDPDELASLFPRNDQPDSRPPPQQGPSSFQQEGSRGKTPYSRQGVNPVKLITDPRKRKAAEEVFDAFAGPPKKRNPDHVKLKGAGWAMAQRVFSPNTEWPTKELNSFVTKHLTLVPEQKKEFESDLVQESFLKDYEKTPGYKQSFEYKNKQFASIRMQRTSLVPLFKLVDELTQVKRDMDDTLDGCGAAVADKDDPSSEFLGWGGNPSLHCFGRCRPTLRLTLGRNPWKCKWMI